MWCPQGPVCWNGADVLLAVALNILVCTRMTSYHHNKLWPLYRVPTSTLSDEWCAQIERTVYIFSNSLAQYIYTYAYVEIADESTVYTSTHNDFNYSKRHK